MLKKFISNKQNFRHFIKMNKVRQLSVCKVLQQQQQQKQQQQQQQQKHDHATNQIDPLNDEWLQAKDYKSMPGPSRIQMLANFFPGGKLYKKNLIEMNRIMREIYGDVYRLKGMLGKADVVFTYNPKDIETTYRNEGIWPIRIGLESFTYYRKEKRPDVFGGIGGLVSEQGKEWADIRNKVNPVLMKPENVLQTLPQLDEIAKEFVDRIESERDAVTHQLNADFHELLKLWAFESISFVALNTRMGLLTGSPDKQAHALANNMSDFFKYSFKYDVQPSIWQHYETPGFKKFLKTYDNITEITINYIETAIRKFEAEENREAMSVLEKLCRLDKQVAIVMAMDMLMAGMDTTSSAFVTILYHLARNPIQQTRLRAELKDKLPNADAPLTPVNTKNMPYLRACIKEALRITSITPGNFRMCTKDLVLSGYRVPSGTGILMGVLELSNTDKYFPRSAEFMPERWLKTGAHACPAARTKNPFVYLPFGFGPRTCIGKRIAELEMETLLIRLLRKYKISWQCDGDLKYISNIIIAPDGDIRFKFEPI